MPNQRLNLILAQYGVASRRKADELIASGHVTVDGRVVRELGTKIDPSKHKIAVDHIPLERPRKRHAYFAFYKPRNVITTMSDPQGRPTVADYLPKEGRIFPVGRLDYDAEGLLLFTSDGELAHKLMHPRFGAKRTYLVKVKGTPPAEVIHKLRRGVKLEDGFAKPEEVRFESSTRVNTWFRMTVSEGRNRLIKRLWLRLEHPVQKLIRIEFASIQLGDLRPGRFRPLRGAELETLKKEVQTHS